MLAGCGAAIHYRPRDWRVAGPQRWAAAVEGLDIETTGIVSEAGAKAIHPELTIHNTALVPAVLTRGRLVTQAGVFDTEPAGPDSLPSRTVAPGETKRVTLTFRFEKPLSAILVGTVELSVFAEASGAAREVRIPLQKE